MDIVDRIPEQEIRIKTYEDALAEYQEHKDTPTAMEPVEAIATYNLEVVDTADVNPADYPAGTWFYYLGDGTVAVGQLRAV